MHGESCHASIIGDVAQGGCAERWVAVLEGRLEVSNDVIIALQVIRIPRTGPACWHRLCEVGPSNTAIVRFYRLALQ